jgi:hypothetical protein
MPLLSFESLATRLQLVVAIITTMAASTSTGHAQHPGDIYLEVVDGGIATGLIDKDEVITLPVFVFAGEFGETGLDGFTDEPGFDTLPGAFQPGTAIGFNVLEGLQAWNGSGFEPAGAETLTISFEQAFITVADKPVAGFTLAVQPNGGWHRHFNLFISGPNASPAAPGVYLLVREMYSTNPDVDPSRPFWLVLNHNDTEENHDAAIAWVQDNFALSSCPTDLTGDDITGGADLGVLLLAWESADPEADLNDDGTVDGADLGILLLAWGACS